MDVLYSPEKEAERKKKWRRKQNKEYKLKESKRIAAHHAVQRQQRTPLEVTEAKAKNRSYVQKYREKKRLEKEADVVAPRPRGFRSPQSLGKSLKRVQEVLPNSPSKRRQLIQGICAKEQLRLHQAMINQFEINEVNELVRLFYLREDISYTAPGMKDQMVIWESGVKRTVTKHYLNMFIKEAYALFNLEHQNKDICFSKFAHLRPQNVLLMGDTPFDQCKCLIHENLFLRLKGLGISYSNNFWVENLCDVENLSGTCWKG